MLSPYRTALCGLPTANSDSSAQCGSKVLLPALSPDSNCQLVSSDSLQTLPLPIVSPSAFLIALLYCLYQKDKRILIGELEGLDGSVSAVPSYRLSQYSA